MYAGIHILHICPLFPSHNILFVLDQKIKFYWISEQDRLSILKMREKLFSGKTVKNYAFVGQFKLQEIEGQSYIVGY